MREFQPTGKRPEELRQTEAGARGILQEFLDSNYGSIRKMRVWRQIMDMQGNISSQATKELESSINEEKGTLDWGHLCEIGRRGEEFANSHDGSLFGKELTELPNAIRGFFFSFPLGETEFECVVLDHGKSRAYFDEKDANGRRQFIERFANRRKNWLLFTSDFKIWHKIWQRQLPLWFTAFLTDTGEKLVIEEIVAYRNKQRLKRRH